MPMLHGAPVSWDLMSQQDVVESKTGCFDLMSQDVDSSSIKSFEEVPSMRGGFGLMSQGVVGQNVSQSNTMRQDATGRAEDIFDLSSQDFPSASAGGLFELCSQDFPSQLSMGSAKVASAIVRPDAPVQMSGVADVVKPSLDTISSNAPQPHAAESPLLAPTEPHVVVESAIQDKSAPSTTVLKNEISAALVGRDLTQTSLKDFRRELEVRLQLELGTLDARKEEVGELIQEEFVRIQTACDTPTTPKKKSNKHGNGAKSEHKKKGMNTNNKWISKRGHKRSRDGMVRENEENDKVDERKVRKGEKEGNKSHYVARVQATEAVQPTTQQTEFLGKLEPLVVEVGDQTLKLPAKLFASGNCGFYTCARISLNVDGVPREAQCQINCALIGSRDWADAGHGSADAPEGSIS